MNNQAHLQPHYTLPGVMHYLQSEFSRNERDRIAWELERSEMKARIAQLEGENKDLRHDLMRLTTESGTPDNEVDTGKVAGKDLTGLLKSKMAVQESVKEIIYLFKSPNVATQMDSLNGKKDPIHELQKLNLNHDNSDLSAHPLPGTQIPEINLHQIDSQQKEMERGDSQAQETNSDAATVVMRSDSEDEKPHEEKKTPEEGRRRRSSSLFTSVKVAPIDSIKSEVDHSRDLAKISSLFQNNGSNMATAVTRLRALGSQILSYSENDRLKLWQVGPSLQINKTSGRSFQAISSMLVDFYWLDSKRFLVLDGQSIKLYSVASEGPIISQNIPEHLEFRASDLIDHDFTNNWFLFVLRNTIKLLEVQITSGTSPEQLLVGKSFAIDGDREILSATFGMTEKSLIVFYHNPYEIVIYNYQGTVLQRINVSKELTSVSAGDSRPQLILNKKSSKLMIALRNHVLVYSFDQKKFILNGLLDSNPVSVIFKTPKDSAVFTYEDGDIEIKNLKDLSLMAQMSRSGEVGSQNEAKVKSVDSAIVNSTPVIVCGHNDGAITLQKLPELNDI